MKEELQITEGARLAGTKAPVQLSQERANAFVSKTLDKGESKEKDSFKSIYSRKPLYAWGSTFLAAAACFLIGFYILKPSNGSIDNYGQPGSFMENKSSHSTISVLDSTQVTAQDTVEITVVETIE